MMRKPARSALLPGWAGRRPSCAALLRGRLLAEDGVGLAVDLRLVRGAQVAGVLLLRRARAFASRACALSSTG